MQGISDFLAVRQRHVAANATLFQIIEQDFVIQWAEADFYEAVFLVGCGLCTLLLRTKNGFGRNTAKHIRNESGLCLEITAACKFSCKGEYIPATPDAEVLPHIFQDVHPERRCPFFPVRGGIPPFVPFPGCRLMSHPCQKIRDGNLSYFLYIHKP